MADTITYGELEEMAARAKGYLRWATFLLVVMGLILILDLQLKRSVGRLAVRAAHQFSGAADEQRTVPGRGPARDLDHAGRNGGDGLDAAPGMEADVAMPVRKGRVPPPSSDPSVRQRAQGDGG